MEFCKLNHICPQIYTVQDEMLYDDSYHHGGHEIRRGKTCAIPGDLLHGLTPLTLIL